MHIASENADPAPPNGAPGAMLALRRPDHVPIHLLVYDHLPVGRAGNGLVLLDELVSRRHCEFRLLGGGLMVSDLASRNGTMVNGVALTGSAHLELGDVIDIGGARFTFEGLVPGGPPGALHTEATTVVGGTERRAPDVYRPESDDLPPPVVGHKEEQRLRASIVGSTVTLVFTDIVGSTVLVNRLGDQEWLHRLRQHDDLAMDVCRAHSGTVVKKQGDGFLFTFPSARHAVLFAMRFQQDLADHRRRDPDFPIEVRIGAHTGEVLSVSGDVIGSHVHRAARVAGVGGAGEVVVSSLVYELAGPMGDLGFGPAEPVAQQGFGGVQVVHRVTWTSPV